MIQSIKFCRPLNISGLRFHVKRLYDLNSLSDFPKRTPKLRMQSDNWDAWNKLQESKSSKGPNDKGLFIQLAFFKEIMYNNQPIILGIFIILRILKAKLLLQIEGKVLKLMSHFPYPKHGEQERSEIKLSICPPHRFASPPEKKHHRVPEESF